MRDDRLLRKDILTAPSRIDSYTRGMSFEAFTADEKTANAVINNFLVIGEAVKLLPQTVTEPPGIRNVRTEFQSLFSWIFRSKAREGVSPSDAVRFQSLFRSRTSHYSSSGTCEKSLRLFLV